MFKPLDDDSVGYKITIDILYSNAGVNSYRVFVSLYGEQ